mmetsp:Transcript_72868/g.122710  ORF Transcript_72868/g.122710 Transcript_72868/m.122710 type:complete len:466 (-) Transcript_72868:463-1860(-)
MAEGRLCDLHLMRLLPNIAVQDLLVLEVVPVSRQDVPQCPLHRRVRLDRRVVLRAHPRVRDDQALGLRLGPVEAVLEELQRLGHVREPPVRPGPGDGAQGPQVRGLQVRGEGGHALPGRPHRAESLDGAEEEGHLLPGGHVHVHPTHLLHVPAPSKHARHQPLQVRQRLQPLDDPPQVGAVHEVLDGVEAVVDVTDDPQRVAEPPLELPLAEGRDAVVQVLQQRARGGLVAGVLQHLQIGERDAVQDQVRRQGLGRVVLVDLPHRQQLLVQLQPLQIKQTSADGVHHQIVVPELLQHRRAALLPEVVAVHQLLPHGDGVQEVLRGELVHDRVHQLPPQHRKGHLRQIVAFDDQLLGLGAVQEGGQLRAVDGVLQPGHVELAPGRVHEADTVGGGGGVLLDGQEVIGAVVQQHLLLRQSPEGDDLAQLALHQRPVPGLFGQAVLHLLHAAHLVPLVDELLAPRGKR